MIIQSTWDVAKRVATQMRVNGTRKNGVWGNPNLQVVHDELTKLGPNPDPTVVLEILKKHEYNIGRLWQGQLDGIVCSECAEVAEKWIEFGDDYDYEQQVVQVCKDCLYEAIKLFDGD